MAEPWLCESIRLTAMWSDPADFAGRLDWESVVGSPADQRESQPKQRMTRDHGMVFEGTANLELRAMPGRVDWLLLPIASLPGTTSKSELPNVGMVDEAITRFDRLLFDRAASAYDALRLAVGIAALHPAKSRDDSYHELAELLANLNVPTEGVSEFLFQINRPRQSITDPQLMLNRLSRWMSIQWSGVQLVAPVFAGHQFAQVKSNPRNATRVEIDISTPAERLTAIQEKHRLPLFREMGMLALEILANGDRP